MPRTLDFIPTLFLLAGLVGTAGWLVGEAFK